jgi:hypothetical protein
MYWVKYQPMSGTKCFLDKVTQRILVWNFFILLLIKTIHKTNNQIFVVVVVVLVPGLLFE